MATIFDANLFAYISPIIIFLFVYALFYGFLAKIKLFGDNFGINAMVSFCIAILFLIIPEAGAVLQFFTPWLVVFIVFGFSLMIFFLFLGVKHEDIVDIVKDHGSAYGLILAVILVLFLVSFANVFGSNIFAYPGSGSLYWWDVGKRVIFNPKILGMLIILVVASESIRQFGYKE